MYKYELINNHYIIDIDGYKYVLDTGCPMSFKLNPNISNVVIDDRTFPIYRKYYDIDINKTKALIGIDNIDGFIGNDIVTKTSLTIYKNGYIDFKAHDINGHEMNLFIDEIHLLMSINTSIQGQYGQFVIDTGAMVGYGAPSLFTNLTAFNHIKDYSPIFGDLDSDIYHLRVDINGVTKNIDVCDNRRVSNKLSTTLLVANVTSLFDEVCVFDIKNNKLILK